MLPSSLYRDEITSRRALTKKYFKTFPGKVLVSLSRASFPETVKLGDHLEQEKMSREGGGREGEREGRGGKTKTVTRR